MKRLLLLSVFIIGCRQRAPAGQSLSDLLATGAWVARVRCRAAAPTALRALTLQ